MPLQPLDGRQRPLQPLEHGVGRQEAQIVRRERGEKTHPDVRRRGPVRHDAGGLLLEVVGREPVVLGAGQRLEVAPGLPRDREEELAIRGRQLAPPRCGRLAQPVGQEGRDRPESAERQGEGKSTRDAPRR